MRKLSLKELRRCSIDEFKSQAKLPIRIVLDNIRSALNVGSAFRTADAFAIERIYLCGITAKPPHREILKTAIGATDSVEWEYSPSTFELIKQLKAEGVRIVGVEQVDHGTFLQDFQINLDFPSALVFGNEVKGIQDEVIPLLDECIEIPQFGTKHSLNVSVSIGVVLWEFLKAGITLETWDTKEVEKS